MSARVLLLDNYDSFTFNLAQALMAHGAEVWVHRNDQITVEAALDRNPTHVVISPGPGRPEAAGISMALIRAAEGKLPVLGVCLGHQAICAVYGGSIVHAPELMHGKSSEITHDGRTLFQGLPQPMQVARYHSLIATDLPHVLEISARTAAGEIMAVRHRELAVEGVQFHPESVLCPDGPALLANFLALGRSLKR